MLPAASHDPTDCVGARFGAYAIDGVLGLLFVGLALLVGTYEFYERQPVADPDTALATCDAFDAESLGETDGLDEPGAPGGPLEDGDGRVLDYSDRDLDTELCLPLDEEIIWVDLGALAGAGLRLALISSALSLLNRWVLQALTGASIGKHLVGLRVVRADGHIAGAGRILLRELLLGVDAAIGGMVGLIAVLTTRSHQRVGDLAASTYVVRRADVGQPVALPPRPAPVAPLAPMAPMAPVPPPHPDGPHWEPHRGTWIRYDRGAEHWEQWDAARSTWVEIDT